MTAFREVPRRGHSRSDRRLPWAATVLLAAFVLAADASPNARLFPPRAADTAPVRILLGWAGDPATSQAVTWRTADPVASPQAQIGLAAAGCGGTTGPARTVTAAPRTVKLGKGRAVTHYKTEFTGLTPSTRYAYRVGSGSSFSNWHCFITASSTAAPFRFIYLGDAQNGLERKWPPVVQAAFAAAPDARFVAHAGDLVGEGDDDTQWGEWLAGLGARAAETPGVPAPGNHDFYRSIFSVIGGTVFTAPNLWNAHFALPANGPPDLPELAGQNYYLDYQGVRIVALDVNAFANDAFKASARSRVRAAQVTWLRRVLGTNLQRWTVVVQHHPMYSVVKRRDFKAMRAALGPLYDEFRVDLVLQGHDHAYARTHKVFDGRLADPKAPGTVYATSVSGSKVYAITTRWPPLMATLQQDAQLYQVVSVTGDRLQYQSRGVDGGLVDAFELVKAGGPASSYVNMAPTGRR